MSAASSLTLREFLKPSMSSKQTMSLIVLQRAAHLWTCLSLCLGLVERSWRWGLWKWHLCLLALCWRAGCRRTPCRAALWEVPSAFGVRLGRHHLGVCGPKTNNLVSFTSSRNNRMQVNNWSINVIHQLIFHPVVLHHTWQKNPSEVKLNCSGGWTH